MNVMLLTAGRGRRERHIRRTVMGSTATSEDDGHADEGATSVCVSYCAHAVVDGDRLPCFPTLSPCSWALSCVSRSRSGYGKCYVM